MDKFKNLKIRGDKPVLLQVLPSLESGGVERGTVDIAKAARDAGFISIVASNGGKYEKDLEEAAIRHIKLPLASKNIFTILLNIYRLKKVIDKHRVDIVHARSRAPGWSAYFAAKIAKVHFVTTFHGTYSMNGWMKRFYNSVMVKGEKVIAISDFIAGYIRQFYELPDDKVVVIHRGVDLDTFDPKKIDLNALAHAERVLKPHKDYPVIFMPARITRWKGQDFILRSLGRLKTKEYVCVFSGKYKEGSQYVEELRELKTDLNLRGNVSITDAIERMPAAYKRADLVISGSLKPEAFGRIAVEAQAMGTPVIATDIGGSKETIIDGETGFLVPANDDEALANTISKVLSMSTSERQKFASRSRAHVEKHFSLAQMAEKTIGLYKEVLCA